MCCCPSSNSASRSHKSSPTSPPSSPASPPRSPVVATRAGSYRSSKRHSARSSVMASRNPWRGLPMPERLELVDLRAVYAELRTEIDAAIRRVCESSAFIGGREVAGFEEDWAAFVGARHAIGVANGTDAIELVLRALGLPAGSEALVPANTFIATAEAVVAAGLIPRFD